MSHATKLALLRRLSFLDHRHAAARTGNFSSTAQPFRGSVRASAHDLPAGTVEQVETGVYPLPMS